MLQLTNEKLSLVLWLIIPSLSIVLWWLKADSGRSDIDIENLVWSLVAASMIATGLTLMIVYRDSFKESSGYLDD
jgi:hypothetical protein